MEKIIYNLVFNQKRQLNEEGMALIHVEAIQNEEKRFLSTKVFIKPKQWDPQTCSIKNHSEMKILNRYLQGFISGLEERELDTILKGNSFNLKDLQADNQLSFIDFMKKEIELNNLKISTKKNHYSTLSALSFYKKDILINEVSYSFLCEFESFLLAKGYHRNTISKHMRHVKRYINLAINKDLFDVAKYPFRKFKIHNVDSPRVHLTPEELNKFEKLALRKRGSLRKSLDMFLFSCYTGLRFSDVASIGKDNFLYIDKKLWLIFSSTKTEVDVRLPLYLLFEGKAIPIYEKYITDPSFFNINVKSNSNINKQLLILARLAGVNKKISFHTARHSIFSFLLETSKLQNNFCR